MVVTVTGTLLRVLLGGAVAVIWPSELTAKVAGTEPKLTPLTLAKFAPAITTPAPLIEPAAGETELIVGGGKTVAEMLKRASSPVSGESVPPTGASPSK